MTGMKEGTGSDPFAEDVVDEPEEPDTEASAESGQDTNESETVLKETSTSDPSPDASARAADPRPSKADIPYIFRRDRVTDERTLHSYYLRDHVDVAEQECRHDVQQQLGEEVPKADLREAALLVAYRNPDLVATELREWGYDME